MILKKQFYIFVVFQLSFTTICFSQNLLDTSSWTIGTGSVFGFTVNGSASENSRELGYNHIGESVIIWKATPDNANDADGGWNSTYQNIDKTKTYRFSVWIKKTNSNDGTTYFGCQQWQDAQSNYPYTILNLNNSVNNNPYFWYGDLPKLNRWYLLVGYVHGNDYLLTTSLGKIYDGVTGEAVLNITDFKFSSYSTKLRHRAYLYYDTNTSDSQYFYAPRLELVDGTEPTINGLLSINEDSKLLFVYDNAGNQKQRFYCPIPGCTIPPPPNGRMSNSNATTLEEKEIVNLENEIKLYPNPTKDYINIQLNSEILQRIKSINIYDVNSSLVQEVKFDGRSEKLVVSLVGKPSGVYFLHIHFNDNTSITKKIIKQ